MPKVDKIELTIKGEKKVYEVWFNTKDHFFIKDLPPEIERVSQVVVQNHTSLDKLHDAVRDALFKFHETTKTARKVIIYRMTMSSNMYMNRDGSHMGSESYKGYQKWVPVNAQRKIKDTPHGSAKHTIGLDYNVLMEVQLGIKKYYSINEDGTLGHQSGTDDSMRQWHIIEWTEARERGLNEIAKAMELLAQRMGGILLDPDKTINLLESGIKLLS